MLIIILLITIALSEALETANKTCRPRERLIDTEKGDLYALIDATLGEKITLQCHYCDENDDKRAKIWYKIDALGLSGPHEVLLGMETNISLNRVHENSEHSLIIHNFTENNTGLYYCERFESDNDAEKYNYLVDLVFDDNVSAVERGNFTQWRQYYEDYFVPNNILFSESDGVEFKYVRDELLINMELITQWQPWGPCEVCGRGPNEGVRRKTGYCRIKLAPKNNGSTLNNNSSKEVAFLLNSQAIACRSKMLANILPGISNLTRIIPNFLQVQHCQGTCNPDAEGKARGWKAGKTSAFKYRNTFVLDENSHLTIICPESTLDNVVEWRRNGKVLKSGEGVEPSEDTEEAPRIIVDTFNTLYLIDVQESEEGNYTCQVDDIRMQLVRVFIITKSKLITHAFVRHLMYLGLVLALTLPCYIIGVVIGCLRRRKFKTYQELKDMDEENMYHKILQR